MRHSMLRLFASTLIALPVLLLLCSSLQKSAVSTYAPQTKTWLSAFETIASSNLIVAHELFGTRKE